MNVNRWVQRSIPMALMALVGAVPTMQAQGTELFTWRGQVDREVQITMRGDRISTRVMGGRDFADSRERMASRLPTENGTVTVAMGSGRGSADVIQQPNAANGFTTIVRVQDPQSGTGEYRITAYWQANALVDRRGRDDRGDHGDREGRDARRGGVEAGAFHWTGNVDGTLEIRLQNGRVDYRTIKGAAPTNVRATGSMAMPRPNAVVSVQQNSGRGRIEVLQQPSQYNGFTTVIRVTDSQGGMGFYDFNLYWR